MKPVSVWSFLGQTALGCSVWGWAGESSQEACLFHGNEALRPQLFLSWDSIACVLLVFVSAYDRPQGGASARSCKGRLSLGQIPLLAGNVILFLFSL